MGGVTNALTGMFARARQDASLRQELESNPQAVIEREIGRKLSKEELEAALQELKRNGINARSGDAQS